MAHVKRFVQRTLEKLAKILQQIREFLAFLARKICAISVLNANVCVAKCCIDSSESCADVRSFTPHALGKCNRVFRAPRAETAKILQEIRVLTTKILRERAAKRADFRHRTHLRRSREQCLHLKIFATTPAGLVVCCASQTQKFCNEFANFCAENLHDLGGFGVAREFFALPNAALAQTRTLRRL